MDILEMNTDRNKEKKRHERKHSDQFRKVCNCIPDGVIEENDLLDFLIHYDRYILGIEHTEYFEKDESGSAFLKESESLQDRVKNLLGPYCDQIGLPPTFLGISWKPNKLLTIPRIETLIHDIAKLININMPEEGETITLNSKIFKGNIFPIELIGLTICRSAKINGTSVIPFRGACEQIVKIDELKNIINEKEKNYLYTEINVMKYGY
jgi:hypothetical protein